MENDWYVRVQILQEEKGLHCRGSPMILHFDPRLQHAHFFIPPQSVLKARVDASDVAKLRRI